MKQHKKYFIIGVLLLIFATWNQQSNAQARITLASSTRINVSSGTTVIAPGNLTINSGAILYLTGNMTVSGTLTNSAGTSGLVVTSDASYNGSLIENSGVSATVKRYIALWSDALHGWHFLATPIATFTINGSDFDPGANDDLYRWDETTDYWLNHKAGDPLEIVPGIGYLVAYEATATKNFSGTLNNSDVPKSGLTFTGSSDHTGWNFLGNPYPCALYWNKTAWGLSNVDATAKIWVESNASYTDIAATTGIIPATQGFMVHVTAAGTGSLTIDATDRTHNSQNWYKDVEVNKIKLTAYDPEGNTAQESVIKFNENATTGVDREYDSHFLSGYAPMFYSAADGKALSTNTLPELKEELTIPLYFIKNSSSTFYIEAEGLDNLIPSYPAYLTDLQTNYTQNLTNNPVYSFTAFEGDNSARFLLHFKAVGVEEQNPSSRNIQIWSADKTIYILNTDQQWGTIRIINMFGQKLMQTKLNGDTHQEIHINAPSAYYLVSIVSEKNVVNRKVFVK